MMRQAVACSNYFLSAEKKLLKLFLLCKLQTLLIEMFYKDIQTDFPANASSSCYLHYHPITEHYFMDNKIIQLVIRGILEGGEYSLSGIAYYTRIPFDIVLDAACGNSHDLSITAWTRIVDMYMRAKPGVSKMLLERLLNLQSEDPLTISSLLNSV
ncbi:MAG: hypothetical protein A3F43_01490 [Gammaproteobacteria bacterium RIFCSPHIGHO2_12_FULL_42_10]|nr:MAG: hypothetical protein A3F43_01490 [Gammaproteobacteria bacterium RIFCSPHIGHO2_12_FULL_42_10]